MIFDRRFKSTEFQRIDLNRIVFRAYEPNAYPVKGNLEEVSFLFMLIDKIRIKVLAPVPLTSSFLTVSFLVIG